MAPTITEIAEEAHDRWAAFEKHLNGTTPHQVLGVEEGAPRNKVQRVYLDKNMEMIERAKESADGKKALEQFTTAYNVLTKQIDSMDYQQWLDYKERTKNTARLYQFPPG